MSTPNTPEGGFHFQESFQQMEGIFNKLVETYSQLQDKNPAISPLLAPPDLCIGRIVEMMGIENNTLSSVKTKSIIQDESLKEFLDSSSSKPIELLSKSIQTIEEIIQKTPLSKEKSQELEAKQEKLVQSIIDDFIKDIVPVFENANIPIRKEAIQEHLRSVGINHIGTLLHLAFVIRNIVQFTHVFANTIENAPGDTNELARKKPSGLDEATYQSILLSALFHDYFKKDILSQDLENIPEDKKSLQKIRHWLHSMKLVIGILDPKSQKLTRNDHVFPETSSLEKTREKKAESESMQEAFSLVDYENMSQEEQTSTIIAMLAQLSHHIEIHKGGIRGYAPEKVKKLMKAVLPLIVRSAKEESHSTSDTMVQKLSQIVGDIESHDTPEAEKADLITSIREAFKAFEFEPLTKLIQSDDEMVITLAKAYFLSTQIQTIEDISTACTEPRTYDRSTLKYGKNRDIAFSEMNPDTFKEEFSPIKKLYTKTVLADRHNLHLTEELSSIVDHLAMQSVHGRAPVQKALKGFQDEILQSSIDTLNGDPQREEKIEATLQLFESISEGVQDTGELITRGFNRPTHTIHAKAFKTFEETLNEMIELNNNNIQTILQKHPEFQSRLQEFIKSVSKISSNPKIGFESMLSSFLSTFTNVITDLQKSEKISPEEKKAIQEILQTLTDAYILAPIEEKVPELEKRFREKTNKKLPEEVSLMSNIMLLQNNIRTQLYKAHLRSIRLLGEENDETADLGKIKFVLSKQNEYVQDLINYLSNMLSLPGLDAITMKKTELAKLIQLTRDRKDYIQKLAA